VDKYQTEGFLDILLEKNTINFAELEKQMERGLNLEEKLNYSQYFDDPIFKDESLLNIFNITKYLWVLFFLFKKSAEKKTLYIYKKQN
jgi:hypothetical protein